MCGEGIIMRGSTLINQLQIKSLFMASKLLWGLVSKEPALMCVLLWNYTLLSHRLKVIFHHAGNVIIWSHNLVGHKTLESNYSWGIIVAIFCSFSGSYFDFRSVYILKLFYVSHPVRCSRTLWQQRRRLDKDFPFIVKTRQRPLDIMIPPTELRPACQTSRKVSITPSSSGTVISCTCTKRFIKLKNLNSAPLDRWRD